MAPPKYTLHYFDMAGRAEPLRLAFAVCGVEFTDRRFARDEWPEVKASGFPPYGHVPVLEVETEDGKKEVIAEFSAIMAYIVAAHGAAGGMARTDPLDIARVEEIRSATDAMVSKISPTMWEKDEEKKVAMRAELASTTLPRYLAAIDARLQDSGYVSGDTLTAADINLEEAVAWLSKGILDGIPTTIVDAYPRVLKCAANVRDHPRVVAWHKSRT
ncbi:putative glutathione S-transferase [Tribonema minus]|uniref:Putative glutathione S-transferase n=1 Tax=Tribonema minus TaxID=303371 RepID=A0A835YRD8_9STRA|nr:putative glutathione S-transferase [Tribonema minus]